MQEFSFQIVQVNLNPFKNFSARFLLRSWMLLLFLSFVISSCSTKKNTFTRRAYHNLSAHYNGWWNGNESLKEGVLKLNNNVVDDYSKTLQLFNYGTDAQAATIAGDMDRAIEKGSIVAQRHSMWFKNRERCKWIDDSYLLIGKANFYKQEYTSARQSFNFIISRFYYNDIKNDAQLWLAKSFIEAKNYQKAETLLEEVNTIFDEDQSPFIRKNLTLAYADLYLKSNQEEKAIPFLEQSLALPIPRKQIARISYILAQLYQNKEEFAKANTYYQKVIKLNTTYQMTFNARINQAFLYTQNSENGNELQKSLKKMLKDSKNKNYLDQVYYALADIDLKNNDSLQAIYHLRMAVKSSKQNQTQKAKASLKVGDLLFAQEKYQLANNYYDTATQQLPLDFENYETILKSTTIVSNLSKQLAIVQTQDSLLELGQRPVAELYAIADSLIKIVRDRDQQLRDEESAKQQSIAMGNQMRASPGGMGMPLGGGQWYFYNPQAKSIGFSEFVAKWGNRALADNWRLSNKQASNSGNFALNQEEQNAEESKSDSLGGGSASDPKSRNYYLKDIPRTPEQIEQSRAKIAEALYQAGFIYREELKNEGKAKLTFEQFVDRTEDHADELMVYFQLYSMYDSNTVIDQKNKYKQLIIDKYPNTDYALLVQNPDYYKEMEKKQNYFRDQYTKTYQAFAKDQYLLSLHLADQALKNEQDHPLKANFLYLKALSMAKTNVIDSLYVNLEKLISLYPNADITPLAQEILNRRGQPLESIAESNPTEGTTANSEILNQALTIYTANEAEDHFVLVILDAEKTNINAMVVRIQDYNKSQNPKLSQTSFPFKDQLHIVSIGKFKNQTEAMEYYTQFISDSYVFPEALRNDSKTFVISAGNYSRFFKDKDIEKYESFFKAKY